MKRLLFLVLIFLTACSSAAGNQSTDPSSSAGASPTPAPTLPPPFLSETSTSEQIQTAMLQSATRWQSLRMDGLIRFYEPGGLVMQSIREQVIIDQRDFHFRIMVGVADGTIGTLKASDGVNIHDANLKTGELVTTQYPESARVSGFAPQFQPGTASPNPIWGQIGTQLSQLAFPSDLAQNHGEFKSLGIDFVADRRALVVEWTLSGNTLPSFKAWLDTSTAVILKLQEFGKEGGTAVVGERIVRSITYNETFEASLFEKPSVTPAAMPTPFGSDPLVQDASDDDPGALYFFLQPRQAGQNVKLVRVSAVCIVNPPACPPVEEVSVPFPFSFSLSPLNWSPDGKLAAFAYSDNSAGTPTRMWLFNPEENTWTSVAEFPYIDPPFWSRDGKWIAFRVQDGLGGESAYIVQRDGTEIKQISAGLPEEGKPYVLDGWYTENVIMRSGLPGTEGGVYFIRAATGKATLMFQTMQNKAALVSSPDASVLAYDDYNADSQLHELKIMEPDGANPVTLVSFTGGSLYPFVWSPDSRLIAYNYSTISATGQPTSEVFIAARDGKSLTSVYKGQTVGRLLFSPNGKYLLVEETTSPTGGHLYIVDLTTMQQKMLEVPGLSTDYDWYAPSWRP